MVKGLATSHKNSAKLLAIPFCQGEVPTNPFVKGMCGPLLAIQKVPHSHIKTGVGVHTPAMGIPPGHNGKALNTPLATLLDHIPPVIKQDLDACPVQSLGLPLPATWFVPHQLLYTPSLRKSVSFCLSGPEYEHRKMSYPASSSFCKALLLAPDTLFLISKVWCQSTAILGLLGCQLYLLSRYSGASLSVRPSSSFTFLAGGSWPDDETSDASQSGDELAGELDELLVWGLLSFLLFFCFFFWAGAKNQWFWNLPFVKVGSFFPFFNLCLHFAFVWFGCLLLDLLFGIYFFHCLLCSPI